MNRGTNCTPLENDEGKALHQWLDLMGYRHFHVSNESQLSGRNALIRGAKLKAQGQQRGVPDYCILGKSGTFVWIELKRQKGGTVSKEQCYWLTELARMPASCSAVCRGWEAASKFILAFDKTDSEPLTVPAEPVDCRVDADGNLAMKPLN